MQMHNRIERDHTGVGGFAYDLAVHLAAGRHIDYQVALDSGGARQPVSLSQRAPASVLLLGGAQRSQVRGS
jgi:hypothetical protein